MSSLPKKFPPVPLSRPRVYWTPNLMSCSPRKFSAYCEMSAWSVVRLVFSWFQPMNAPPTPISKGTAFHQLIYPAWSGAPEGRSDRLLTRNPRNFTDKIVAGLGIHCHCEDRAWL